MKKFVDICKMTQGEVKAYMEEYLSSRGYKVENETGFLYAKGDVPVLLVAHMDTVHKEPPKKIIEVDGKISSHQGIGGNDRCGIFIIMNLVKNLHCSVVLCEDEEVGGIGARKFAASPFINNLDVNYIVEFDRMHADDAVFYNCDNPDFTEFVIGTTGFKEAHGSFSDISIIAPAAKIAAVNLSCGYYNAHMVNEYVVYDEMMDTISAAEELIKTECDKFEYIAKKWSWPSASTPIYQTSMSITSRLVSPTKNLDIEIEVTFVDEGGDENTGYGSGRTKAEAWLDFFEQHEDVCFAQVVDYSFV